MPRVTVYVPDDLAEEAEGRKDALNLSQIFQQALRYELAKLKRLEKGQDDMQALIERLRAEKAESEGQAMAEGRAEAESWVKSATYDELMMYGEGEAHGLPEAEHEIALERRENALREGFAFHWDAYVKGWQTYVRSAWAQIKDQL